MDVNAEQRSPVQPSAQALIPETQTTGRVPAVSIGLPVYNGEASLCQALNSLLSQTFTDFELIISDNASIDATHAICTKYAAQDVRVKYVRHAQNMGLIANFTYVLQEARGVYFMWAAADDFWHPTFLEANCAVLSENTDVVASISRVKMGRAKSIGTEPILGEYVSRLRQFLACPGANSRFYSLFRRTQIADAYIRGDFLAYDWAIVINLLKFGKWHELDQTLMERSAHGASRSITSTLKLHAPHRFQKIFPLYDFTRWLCRNVSLPALLQCADLIIRLNIHLSLVSIRDHYLFKAKRRLLPLAPTER